MKESHRKGVAGHPDPESCGASREAAIEALTGGTCRQGMELRNNRDRSADLGPHGGRQCRRVRHRKHPPNLRSLRPLRHAWKLHAREPGDPTGALGEEAAGWAGWRSA